jgi:hypothetical protein
MWPVQGIVCSLLLIISAEPIDIKYRFESLPDTSGVGRLVNGIGSYPALPSSNLGKASTCHSEKSKTKRTAGNYIIFKTALSVHEP